MTTLIHTCCGPCASACLPRLKEMGREVTMFFANSNIDTREEFDKRLHEAEKLAAVDGVKIAALPYDHDEWLREVAAGYKNEPEKGARCTRCFRYNLRKTLEYAAANGYGEFTTSLTVSPHKVSKTIFAVAEELAALQSASSDSVPAFLPEDFKKREGFKLSTKRAKELGLYRQTYCGCEFSKNRTRSEIQWKVHHKESTQSTNLDAREGHHGDVYTADFQSAGRGRLDHKWQSPPGQNLMMSVVLSVEGLPPDQVSTLPLVIGLAVVRSVTEQQSAVTSASNPSAYEPSGRARAPREPHCIQLKWPNDVLVNGKKLSGILCERHGDDVIVGIGVNVHQTSFPSEIAEKSTSLAILATNIGDCPHPEAVYSPSIEAVRDAILRQIGYWYSIWKESGFAAVYPELSKIDALRGRRLSVRQTDDDIEPISGISAGIQSDGSLEVAGTKVYAGEAHVMQCA